MRKRHLVIFARAPQAGRVKRRLAGEIGTMEAARFYRRILTAQIERLTRDPRWTVWMFVTPDTALRHQAWRLVPIARRRPQRRGDLGHRMKRPFEILPPGPVVLVGSDIPAMRPCHVARAFALLGTHDLVFGPARDGGFWLMGAKRLRPLPRTLFDEVPWSTATVLADTLASIPWHVTTALADTLDDVDDVEALRRTTL
ncbi:TIGR04282 family arsenosugar biosynthesis glycosyltransferase [Reyranella aquatilis]|uniref:TIGR04282 family arsenosugar biosynthesis glycosyltransferase n=1 Tax=Reyranella aquatilis TaxID=2035356 RepID=A0ABS8KW18_9HYPH|nr:TIGR04282 family arsenosugar biosynthesis glycosyltransferase [Reyranella aquatilis]MCC8430285.1 TIGR04282 family arsenosugar biosynthesis glycosyltransferase [Reyranella aquatilis]